MSLDSWEIRLIKGLFHNAGLSQQEIIAYFSFPERTVHHNKVSAATRDLGEAADPELIAASSEACDRYKAEWDGSFGGHRWAVFAAFSEEVRRSSPPLRFSFSFHPVGQGLFCSGAVWRRSGRPFRWVYDCGTEHGRSSEARRDHVRREIDRLTAEQDATGAMVPHLDLVTLSHFDEDHLSGLLDLVSACTIGTLLLPHVLPWDRLLIALIEEAAVDSDLLDFLLEPTAFLLARADGRIGRILLVGSGGEGPALPPAVPPSETPPEDEESAFDPEIEGKGAEPEPEMGEAAGEDRGLRDRRVRMLPRGGAITVGRAWEFVPYNDGRLAISATPSFKIAARALAAGLRRSVPAPEREESLNALVDLFDETFKTPTSARISARRRNEISLFLYSGPVGRVELLEADEYLMRHRLDDVRLPSPREWLGDVRFGQMLTGDGYLKTSRQWNDFRSFYASHQRLQRAGFLQVMHHGAEENWQPNLAARLAPLMSVFCSDPAGHNGHPRPAVLDDFKAHNPKQVDAFHGLRVEGSYRFI